MTKFKIMLAVFFTAICVVSASTQTLTELTTKYTEASTLLKSNKAIEAIPVFEEVIQMGLDIGEEATKIVTAAQSTLPHCYFRKGQVLAKDRDFDGAIIALTKAGDLGELYGSTSIAVKSKVMISRIYSSLAAAAFNSKDYPKAIEIYNKGYAANSRDTQLALNLAKSYLEMGDTTGYIVYKKVMALGKTHSKYEKDAETANKEYIYYRILDAQKLSEAKNFPAFFAVIDNILEVAPTEATAPMLALQVANNAKNYNAVIKYGDSAIASQVDPASKGNVAFLVASAYENKDNKLKAIEYYKKVTAGSNVATAKTQIEAINKELAQ